MIPNFSYQSASQQRGTDPSPSNTIIKKKQDMIGACRDDLLTT